MTIKRVRYQYEIDNKRFKTLKQARFHAQFLNLINDSSFQVIKRVNPKKDIWEYKV
jgi:hypothetical protein